MSTLDKEFTSALHKSPYKGGWTYAMMDGSAEFFGTRGLVKVAGTVDGRGHDPVGSAPRPLNRP